MFTQRTELVDQKRRPLTTDTGDGTDLRELMRAALRTALQSAHRGRGQDGEVRRALRQVCAAAQARETHAENMVVLLKQAWRELPEARRGNHDEMQETFARMVTFCIEEYYAQLRSR